MNLLLKFFYFFTIILSVNNVTAQTIVYTDNSPSENFINEEFCYTDFITNSGAPGYGPYVRIEVPPNVSLGTVSFQGSAATTSLVGTFSGGLLGDPMLTSGTLADSVAGTTGNDLYVIEFPVGSMVTGGPDFELEICWTIELTATVGVAESIFITPVYTYGDTPTGDNGPIIGAVVTESVIPIVYLFTKESDNFEEEATPGACTPVLFTLDLDVANTFTVDNIDVTDLLPAGLQYVTLVSNGGCAVVSEPSTVTPGGTLSLNCGSVTGALGSGDATIIYEAFYTDILDELNCATIDVFNAATAAPASEPAQTDADTTTVRNAIIVHTNNAGGSVISGQTVTYAINTEITEFTAGMTAYSLEFVVPDGMTFNAGSILLGGAPVAPANVTTVAGPGTGSTVTVNILGELGSPILPCTTPVLTYTADVAEDYANGDPVLSRDALNNTSNMTYGLTEGAAGCTNPSASGIEVVDISISKTINNSPPVGAGRNGQWIPGDIIQYRLEMNIPSQDLDGVVITDFFPLPIHDVATLAPAFGTDVTFDPASGWITAPIGYTISPATNSLELDFGDVSNGGLGTSVDIIVLIDIVIEAVPYANGLFHSNFMGAVTDNTNGDGSVSSAGTLFQVGTPDLTIDKSIVSSDNTSASISGGNITGVDASDTVFFALTATNVGGAQAYDVTFTDAVPAGLSSCELIATDPVTLSGMTPMTFTGGFTGNNLAITLTDSIPFSGNPGGDAAVVNFYCLVDNTNEPEFVMTNEVTTNWTSSPSGTPFPDITDDATVEIASLDVNKSIDTIFPTNTDGSDVRIGDNITYTVVVDIPEGGITNLNFHDELSNGLAFVSIDDIIASPGLTSSLGAFAGLIGTEVYSNPGINPEQDDQIMDLALGDVTNTDTDNTVTETITITYTTSVLNSSVNNRGDVLGNGFDAVWDNPNGGGTLTQSGQAPNITIAEPELEITKSFLNNQLVPGDETFVTLNVGHVPVSDASAYDVVFSDTLPIGLNYVPGSNSLSGSFTSTPVVSVAGNIISVSIDSLSTSEDISLTFVVEVDDAFPSCDTIENCGYVAWESLLDVSQGGLPTGINNAFVGERTGDVNDIGGANNTHSHVSCTNMFTTNGLNTDPNITSTGTVCEGQQVTLSVQQYVGGQVSYEWNGPGIPPAGINSNVVTFNPVSFADTGDYTLVVNVDGCVSDTSQIFNLQIFENPTAAPTNNGTLCMAQGVDLVLTSNVSGGTGPFTYAWTGPNGFTSQAQDPIIPNPTSANSGMYFVTITDVNGCSNPVASTTVNVSETPAQPNLVSNSPVCEGEDVSITALNYTGNTVTYNWTGPNGPITLNSNVLNLSSVDVSDAGNYTLEVVVDGCNSQITTLAVQVNSPPPAIIPISNSPLCENDTLFLMANNTTGSTYSFDWTGPNSFSSNAENPEIYGVTSANNAGFYSLVVTDSNGCTTQGSVQVTVFDKPATPTISASDADVCIGESTSISSNTAYTGTVLYYIWTGPNGIDTTFVPTLNISPATIADSGLYMLDVEVDGCTSNTSSSVLISVNENTQVPVIVSNSPVCEAEDIVLTTPTVATTYNWTGPNGFTSNLQSPPAITGSALTAGTYNLSTIDNGCESVTTTEIIVVNATPIAPITTGPSAICDGDDLVLSTSATCDSYMWIAPSGADASNPLLNTAANTTTIPSSDAAYASGDWSVVCISPDGCESAPSTPINVTINAIPTAVVFNDGPICDGGDVTLTGNTVAGSTQTWFDELYTTTLATTAVHSETNLAAGTYTFNYVLNSNGCVDTASTIVTVDPQLAAPTIAVSLNSVCEGEDFILSTSTSADSYLWSGPNGYTSTSQNPPGVTASSATAGTYSLIVTQNGCQSAPASETVVVNAAPSAPTITGPGSICDGDDILLSTSSTCDSYLWIGPGGSSASTLANPLLNTAANTTTIPSGDAAYAGGNWSVVCVSPDGCESPESAPITVNIQAPVIASASNDGPICDGGDVTLTGNTQAGSTQTWFDEVYATTLATTPIHTETNLVAGTYTFNYVLNINGCVDTASTVVTIDATIVAPVVVVSSSSVCEGEEFILSTSTAADSYLWSGPNGYSSTSQAPPAIIGSSATTGTYSLVVTIGGCTSPAGSQTVVVNATPSAPTITGPASVCDGDDLVFATNSTCDSYMWMSPNGFDAVNPLLTTVANTTTIPSGDAAYASGNWSVVCVSPDGCQSQESAPISVTINAIPTAVAFNDGPICDNGDVNLTGNTVPNGSYQWFDELYTAQLSSSSTHQVTNLSAGTYTFNYIVNSNNCVDTASTVVTVDPPVAAPAMAVSSSSVCEGEEFILSTSTAADSYAWSGPNGYASTSQSPPTITGSSATAGTYSLVVTQGGCTSLEGSQSVVVNALPSAPTITGPLSICDGDDLVLSTSSTCDSYLWIGPGGSSAGTLGNPLLNTTANTTTIPFGDAAYTGGNWSVVCVSPDGCESPESTPINVNIQSAPIANATNNGPICDGGDVTLTGNTETGSTQTWFDELYTTTLATTPVHTEQNLAAGTYTFNYVLNVNGCVDTASTVVTVDPPLAAPVVVVSSNSVCEGEQFILSTSTTADSYLWSGPNGYSSTSQSPPAIIGSTASAGTYSLIVTQNGCTSAAGLQTVIVNALPSAPTISGPASICAGDDLVLSTSSSCDSYLWIGPGGSSSGTLSNPLLNTTANTTTIPSGDVAYAGGDWSVVCVSPQGCESPQSAPINVTIIPVPQNAVAASNSPVCEGDDILLTTNGLAGATYVWSGTNGFSSVDQNPIITNAQSTDAADYSVTISFMGCSSSTSTPTTVIVNPIPPAPMPLSNSPVCEGDTIFLYSNTTASNYSWTGPNGFTATTDTAFIPNSNATHNGFYNLTTVVGGCLSPAGQVQVDVVPSSFIPTISSVDNELCEGDVLELNTTGFNGSSAQYIWYGPSGTLDTTFNPTYIDTSVVIADSGDYYVQVLIGSCLSLPSQIELIDVNPVPTVPDIGYIAVVCEEDFIQLTTTTVADSYSWTGPNGYSSDLQNPAVISPASVINTGNYSLNVTLDGCTSADSMVTITVNPKPASPTIFGDSPICVGDSLIVHTTSLADNYQWTAPNGTVTFSPQDSLVIYPVLPGDAGTYTLELEVNGCFSDAITIDISIDDSTNAIAYAGEDFFLCNEANVVNLNAFDNGNGFWTTNSDATIISTNDPMTLVTDLVPDSTYIFYWTLVSGSCGGTTMDSISIYVPPNPDANADYVTVTAGQSVNIPVMDNDSAYISGGVSVMIDPLQGLTSIFANEIEYTADEDAGTSDQFVYELCYEACPEMCDTAFVNITINPLLNIPDIITPNGDGSNDAFVIEGIQNYPDHELKIFNRWGNEIYFSDNYQNDWDGIYNNEELPDGTYYYVLINTEDGELLMNGYITLHR